MNRLRDRFGAKILAIGVATALLGGGVAVAALVEPAEQALAEVAAQIGVADRADLDDTELDDTETEVGLTTDAGIAQIDDILEDHPIFDDGNDVPQEVKDHFAAVITYVSCIQENARAHGEKQASDERGEDAEFGDEEKTELCGDEPVNPNDEEGETEGESDSRPAFLGEGEGRPAFLGAEGEGRPTFVGGQDRP